jgi:hypothetical protein
MPTVLPMANVLRIRAPEAERANPDPEPNRRSVVRAMHQECPFHAS